MGIEDEIARGRRWGSVDTAALSALPPLSGLAPDVLSALAEVTRWQLYAHHETIVRPDGGQEYVFVVAAGVVRRHLAIDGREFAQPITRAGEVIDLADMPDNTAGVMQLRAAASDTLVYQVPRTAFRSAIVPDASPAWQLLDQERRRAERLVQVVEAFAYHGTRSRFAHILAAEASDVPDGVLHLTHEELAAISGLHRQQVSFYLHEFRKHGLVDFDSSRHGRIVVLDVEGLLRL